MWYKHIILIGLFVFVWESLNAQCTIKNNGVDKNCLAWEEFCPDEENVETLPILRVRLQVHVIQDDNGNNNLIDNQDSKDFIHGYIDSANQMLANLPKIEPQADLFPSSEFKDSRIRFYLDSIYYWQSTKYCYTYRDELDSIYFTFVTDNNTLSVRQRDSSLHIFIVRKQSGAGGTPSGISSGDKRYFTWFDLVLHFPYISTPVKTFVHEFGHNCGLAHPFYSDQDFHQFLLGDDCDDTPTMERGHSNNLMESDDNDDLNIEYSALSEQQVGKMRYCLLGYFNNTSDDVIRDWCDFISGNDITVSKTGFTHWKVPRLLSGNLILDSGVALILSDTLSMPPGGKIYVHPGASLIAEQGAVITNVCGKMWGGIVVLGDSSSPQFSINQGEIQLSDCIIEHAETAILFGGEALESAGGMMSYMNNVTFKNCKKGLTWQPYNNEQVHGDITNCTFINDDHLPSGENFEYHAKLDGVEGIRFMGCTFENSVDTPPGNYRGTGIVANNSNFTVRAESYQMIGDCNYGFGTLNTFEGLTKGVDYYGEGIVKVLDAEFRNVQYAVSGYYNDSSIIWKNSIIISDDIKYFNTTGADSAIGVKLENCRRFAVDQNNIVFDSIPDTSSNKLFAIWVDNSYQDQGYGRVHLNTLEYVPDVPSLIQGKFEGLHTRQDNRNLTVSCNYFNNFYTDWYNEASSSIPDQGTFGSPAGNIFSTNSVMRIDNQSADIDYHYYVSVAREDPSPNNNVTPRLEISAAQCDSLTCFNPPPLGPVRIFADNDKEQELGGNFSLYPNPFNTYAVLEYNLSDQDNRAIFRIFDMTGKEVFSRPLNGASGKFTIDASILGTGIYFYTVHSSNGLLGNGKMVIQK